MSIRNIALSMLMVTLGVVILSFHGLVAEVANMWDLSVAANPYFLPDHGLILYLALPVVAFAGSLLIFLPGLVLARAWCRGEQDFLLWLFSGTFVSVFGIPFAASLADRVFGQTLEGGSFAVLLLLTCVAGAVLLAIKKKSFTDIMKGRGAELAAMVGVPLIVLVLLLPKIFWEDLNGDGAHLFLSAELFIWRGVPLWPPNSGPLGTYPSMSTVTEVFPHSAFVRLFGANEASGRLTILPGLAVLTGVLLAVIRSGTNGRLSPTVPLGVGAAVVLWAWLVAFNTTYNPYFADIALPMSREPWILIGFLGFAVLLLAGHYVWSGLLLAMAMLTAPNGLLLAGFFIAAFFLVWRPLPWSRAIHGGLVILAVVLVTTALNRVILSTEITEDLGEFGAKAILQRLRYISVMDVERFIYWALPCGIVPVLSLLMWRWQDPLSRVLSLVCAVYFAFFFMQGYRVLPHHFLPAAVLPIVVYWRLRPVRRHNWSAFAVAMTGIAAAAWIGTPASIEPHRYNRVLAAKIEIRDLSGDRVDPEQIRVALDLLADAFPPHHSEEAVKAWHVIDPPALYVYASRPKGPDTAIDYVVSPVGSVTDRAAQRIAGPIDGWEMLKLESANYDGDLRNPGIDRTVSDAFWVPRAVIFSGVGGRTTPVWDLAKVLGIR